MVHRKCTGRETIACANALPITDNIQCDYLLHAVLLTCSSEIPCKMYHTSR